MAKARHEIRDAVHDFIWVSSSERKLIDSRPFQRLRHIHQLSLSYLVYPGATHRRFEHSLGVLEVASRIFDVVTRRENLSPEVAELFVDELEPPRRDYWRQVLRAAALCHDVGHLPFSHAAEGELLEGDLEHEDLTISLVKSEKMRALWKEMKLQPEDVVKVAVGKEHAPELNFSTWEEVLSEMIVHDAFGADRIDYLLRDSHHAGVAYGKFDHYRLIDTLRILPPAPSGGSGTPCDDENAEDKRSREPQLGVEKGGLRTAEALLLARFFMYSQVYFHAIRRIYDHHLVEFLAEWLPEGVFPSDVEKHLQMTDARVIEGLWQAAHDSSREGHRPANRIVARDHMRVVHEVEPETAREHPEGVEMLTDALAEEFGDERVWGDQYSTSADEMDFPVVDERTGDVFSAISLSEPLQNVPPVRTDRIYADQAIQDEAHTWIRENRSRILTN